MQSRLVTASPTPKVRSRSTWWRFPDTWRRQSLLLRRARRWSPKNSRRHSIEFLSFEATPQLLIGRSSSRSLRLTPRGSRTTARHAPAPPVESEGSMQHTATPMIIHNHVITTPMEKYMCTLHAPSWTFRVLLSEEGRVPHRRRTHRSWTRRRLGRSTTGMPNRGLAAKIHPALTYGKRIPPARIP